MQNLESKKNTIFLEKLHGLRGIAVLYVVLFHFFQSIFPGGFVGVDIFFLLSGFLVTRSNLPLIADITATPYVFFIEFYKRRVARILPMLVVSSLISMALAVIFTPANNLSKVLKYTTSALIGFSNLKLYTDKGDYFSLDQEFNWFTQTWSLGVEEQFYVAFSVIIGAAVFFSRNRLKTIRKLFTFLTVVSFVWTLVFIITQSRPSAVFYLLQFRFWEFSLGTVLCFYILGKKIVPSIFYRTENISLSLILTSLFIPYNPVYFPLPQTLLVCSGVGSLILSSEKRTATITEKILSLKVFQYLGTISYSLYLLHWIVLVFLRHTFGEDVFVMCSGVFFSCFLSHLAYKFFEAPVGKVVRNSSWMSYGIVVLLIFLAINSHLINKYKVFEKNYFYIGETFSSPAIHWGEELVCHGRDDMTRFKNPYESCLRPDRKKWDKAVFVTGDSHAAQFSFAAKDMLENEGYELRYINMEGSDDVYDFVRSERGEKLKSEVFSYILKESRSGDILFLTFASYHLKNLKVQSFQEGLVLWKDYLNRFVQKGVKVMLVLDSPVFRHIPLERCYFSALISSISDDCKGNRQELRKNRNSQELFFKSIQKENPRVAIIDLFPFFCDDKECKMIINDELMFFDYHHYTKSMALKISKDLKPKLMSKIMGLDER